MTKPHSDFNDNHFMHVRKTNSVESSNFLLLIVTIYIFSLPTSEHITDMSKKRPIYDNAKFEVALVADMVACFLVLAAESPLLGRGGYFKVDEIANAINSIDWKFSRECGVHERFLGQGLLQFKSYLQKYGVSYTQTEKRVEYLLFGTSYYSTKYGPEFFQINTAFPKRCVVVEDKNRPQVEEVLAEIRAEAIIAKIAEVKHELLASVKLQSTDQFLTGGPGISRVHVVDHFLSVSSIQQSEDKKIRAMEASVHFNVPKDPVKEVAQMLYDEFHLVINAKKDQYGEKWSDMIDTLGGDDVDLFDAVTNTLQHDALLAPTWFKLMVNLAMGDAVKKRVNAQFNEGKPMAAIESGMHVPATLFQNERADDPGNVRLAAKCNIIEREVLLLLHVLIHFQQKGHCPNEFVWLISKFLKNGGLYGTSIDLLGKLGICVSNREITTELNPQDINLFYERECAVMRNLALQECDDADGGFKHIVFLMFDNYASTTYQLEQTHRRPISSTIDTQTNLYQVVQKSPDFDRRPTRAPASTKFDDDVINAVAQVLGTKLQLSGIIGDRRDANFCHLPKWSMLASLPIKSSSHLSGIQFLIMISVFFAAGGAKMQEMVQLTDPEFTLQALKFVVAVYARVSHMVHVPVPFHAQKHAMESLNRQTVFGALVLIPFYRYLKFKKVFEGLEDSINKLVSDADREAIRTEDIEALLSSGGSGAEGVLINDDDEEEEEEEEEQEGEGGINECVAKVLEVIGKVVPPDMYEEEAGAEEDLTASMQSPDYASVVSMKLIETCAVLIKRAKEGREIRRKFYEERQRAKVSNNTEALKRRLTLPSRLAQALALEKKLHEAFIVNHCRLKFMFELLWSVTQYAKTHLGLSYEDNSLTRMIGSFVNDQLRLAVEPFNQLNLHGDLTMFFEEYPRMVTLFSVGEKPKIVRAGIFLTAQILHMVENRPDIMQELALNATKINEVFVEHANSLIQREVAKRQSDPSFQKVRDASIRILKNRQDLQLMEQLVESSKTFEEHGGMRSKRRRITVGGRSAASASTIDDDDDDDDAETDAETSANNIKVEPDSEVRAQVSRFEPDGKCWNYIEAIANDFWLPYIKKLGQLTINPRVSACFDQHRPLETEGSRMMEHVDSTKLYCKHVLSQENKQVNGEAGEPLELNLFSASLLSRKNTKPVLWEVIKSLANQDPRPYNFTPCLESVNKPKYVEVLEEAFGVTSMQTSPQEALGKMKRICDKWTPEKLKFIPLDEVSQPVPKMTVREAASVDHPLLNNEPAITKFLSTLSMPVVPQFPLSHATPYK